MKTITHIGLAGLVLALVGSLSAVASEPLATSELSASSAHALALRSDGTVWAWGTNRIGELGLGTNSLALTPQRIKPLSNIVAISAGPLHSLAVQSNGSVWAWGTNGNGHLGNGTFNNTSNPVAVLVISNAVEVAAGANHSLAVLSNGLVMAWGANNGGQLGTSNLVATNRPVLVNALSNILTVAAGSNFSLALTTSGEVWSWGSNTVGQLGLGNTTGQLAPVKITTLSNIVQISAGHNHGLARNRDGYIFAWGRNAQGELGDGTLNNATTPQLVPGFGPTNSLGAAQWLCANFNSCAAVSGAGRIYYWGFHNNGWTNGPAKQPSLLGPGVDGTFATVSYGEGFLLGEQSDDSVWAWGVNSSGQWGNGTVGDGWQGASYEASNPAFSFSSRPHPRATRFNRGWDNYINYNSFVLPIDLQKGVELGTQGNELYNYPSDDAPWFLKIAKAQRQHVLKLLTGTDVSRFFVDNPMVTFGSAGGGSPLYTGQPQTFGVFGGLFDEKTGQTNMIRISVYDRAAIAAGGTNVTPTNVFYIGLPRRYIAAENNSWSSFIANGGRVVVQTNGLRTEVEFADKQGNRADWGLYWMWSPTLGYMPADKVVLGGYRLTHTALSQSTNYYYMVEVLGSVQVAANTLTFLATTNTTGGTYLPLYAMDFETLPVWRSSFIDQPHFAGIPLPPTYAGRNKKELAGLTAVITNNVWLTNNVDYTNLDTSPELRQHPILDQFVEDMGRDPLALASYVVNEVGLVDPLALTEASKRVNDAIELGGVARSALGTFLEGQGSPTEQCALLVYLLRRAGYPAAYVFPTNSNLRLLDTRVSQLWRMQVKGVIWQDGNPVVTDSLLIANYPWVVANIGTNCVHIFPWLKDTEIVEGLDIYDYMPTNYPTAYHWVKDFIFAKPELMSLATSNSSPATYWKKYLESILSTNQITANLSLDSFGVRAFNRRGAYPTWDHLPKPNFLTNQTQVGIVPTLSENPVTYPFLTSIFDRVSFKVFKTDTSPINLLFDTGEWRVCDVYNRKLLLFTNNIDQVTLYLAPYRPGLTNLTNFSNFETGTNSLNPQQLQTTVSSGVTELPVQVQYKRRTAYFTTPTYSFVMPMVERPVTTVVVPCRKSGFTALVFTMGKVSTEMMRVHADDYWRLETQRAMDPNFQPAKTEDKGTAAMLVGMGFLEKQDRDNQLNAQLHKITGLSTLQLGRAALTSLPDGKMQIGLSMYWNISEMLGNGTLHEESSGDTSVYNFGNYRDMLQLITPAAEHGIITTMFGDYEPISAVRLLQIVSERARAYGWSFPLEANIKNYTTLGKQAYAGYGPQTAEFQDWGTWLQDIPSIFTTSEDTNFLRALVVPGIVNVSGAGFSGSASLFFDRVSNKSILSTYTYTPLNAGISSATLNYVGTPSFSSYELSHRLDYDPFRGFSFGYNNFSVASPQFIFSSWNLATLDAPPGGGSVVTKKPVAFTPHQATQGTLVSAAFNLSGSSPATAIKTGKDRGWNGGPYAATQQQGSMIADPVQVMFGDFYSDTVDVSLVGPMPLNLRRSYFSRNVADNQLGHGWRLGFTPWLVLSTNVAGEFIHASEMDGAVIAYRYQSNNLWTVEGQHNPSLVNFTGTGIGALANQFNNRIERNATNDTLYVLGAANGSKRFYQLMTNFAVVIGTNHLDRTRPYLTRWEDHAGNYLTFRYGTNSAANDFGQLNRVESSSGPFVALKYDFFGRIVEAITDDNRRVRYDYDDYGDLVSVRLPDDSLWEYEYEHYTFTTNSATYTDSKHLLAREVKPDGRILANVYDNLRRVISQSATVGTNRELVTNVWFYYTNNCTSLTNEVLSGVTRVEDVFHNPHFYFYTNNLITKIVEPLGRTNLQDWFEASETNKPGYYPRSLEMTVDARGLTNEFRYDAQGNVTNRIIRGDLTGNGLTSQSATNMFSYTNNLPATITDPSGNRIAYFYEHPSDTFLLTRAERWSSTGVGITTNRFSYTNIIEAVPMSGWFKTNQAFGLLAQTIQADAATNEWAYNGRGFSTRSVQHAKTADYAANNDPAVTNFFTFTARGDLSEQSDALGRRSRMNFDAMGRLQWRDVLDESGTVLGRETFYYNRNGDLEWYDGSRSNPDDFVWFDYDGAGRKTQEIHWRSRAKTDGSGVEAETGDNLYATTFYRYDAFGNLLTITKPDGAVVTNSYDALGQLTVQKVFESNGTLLTSAGFAYEPGGQVAFQTNALGGVSEARYTSTGQPFFRRNADGSTNGWTYYLDGRTKRAIQGNGAYWEFTYDDALRRTTKIFYSPAGVPLTTNLAEVDRRGNLIKTTDAGGYTFTNLFDGLGRLKISTGPAIVTAKEDCGPTPGCGNWVTNVLQQAVTNFYGIAGAVTTNANALGEKTITWFDGLGRPARSEIRSTSGALVRETGLAYAPDHHSVTVTNGSGASALRSTVYTDNDGQQLLSIAYPSANVREFAWNKYDPAGNLIYSERDSSSNGIVTVWSSAAATFDGLSRMLTTSARDAASTTFGYNPLGNVTNRTMPGGLQWNATYNNAGQMLQEWNTGSGGAGTRTNTYSYFSAGHPFAGWLQKITDGRGATCTRTYDDWLRSSSNAYTNASPDDFVITVLQYDRRNFATNITETSDAAGTQIQRQFDAYGQLVSEQIIAGVVQSSASQEWDAAGRRVRLSINAQPTPISYTFGWRADGLLASALGGASYGYTTAGVLTNRTIGNRTTTVTALDGVGRPLSISTKVSALDKLTEAMAWTGDGLLATHTLERVGDFTDSRQYQYAPLSRRLIDERLNVNAATRWTNSFTYDGGAASGPGALTKVGPPSATAQWAGGMDNFSRINTETNRNIRRLAFGRANGTATITALLDGTPQAVTAGWGDDMQWPHRWQSLLEIPAGTHQLAVSAAHPSGMFTTNAVVWFTNNLASENATTTFDAMGNVSRRVWKNPDGTTNRIQTLVWDPKGQLTQVSDLDSQTNGLDWFTYYDALGRRVHTYQYQVLNGEYVAGGSVIAHYYDPEVEFLELGVRASWKTTWKVYGPDASGVYGGMQGVGGLDAILDQFTFTPTISDVRGNVLGAVTNGTVSWTSARPTGYGSVPGHRPPALIQGGDMVAASAWRGVWSDITGFYWRGKRYYDPMSGSWMSSDPVWNGGDPNYHSFCGGDPINFFDADGRFGKQSLQDRASSRANMPAWMAAATAETCMDCHGRWDVLMGGYLPAEQPWYNQGGVNAVGVRMAGGLKVAGGSVGIFIGGTASSTGIGGALGGPVLLASAALVKSGANDIKTGSFSTLVADDMIARGSSPQDAAEIEVLLSAVLLTDGMAFKPVTAPEVFSASPKLLSQGNATTRTLQQVRNLRGEERWREAEQYVQELYGSQGQRHFSVPTTGGRFVDAPVDIQGGGVLANEVKMYQQWRTLQGQPRPQTVPLSDQIRGQVLKEVWLRRNSQNYQPRWLFLDAPPSLELEKYLLDKKIISIWHQ